MWNTMSPIHYLVISTKKNNYTHILRRCEVDRTIFDQSKAKRIGPQNRSVPNNVKWLTHLHSIAMQLSCHYKTKYKTKIEYFMCISNIKWLGCKMAS